MLEKIIEKLNAKQLKEFATDNGWTEEVMTTTESPNYLVQNPVNARQFLRDKFNEPIIEAYKKFKFKSIEELTEEKIKIANEELKIAKSSFSINDL